MACGNSPDRIGSSADDGGGFSDSSSPIGDATTAQDGGQAPLLSDGSIPTDTGPDRDAAVPLPPSDPCGPDHGGCDPMATCATPGVCGPCPATYREQGGACEPILDDQLVDLSLSNGDVLRYYRSHPVGETARRVVRAVIVLHGTSRNGDDYYLRMWRAAQMSAAQGETLIAAPDIKADGDSTAANEAYWANQQHWKDGRDSSSGMSSFQVMDELVQHLVDRDLYPSIRELIVTGHSAGGQFVQRYALMNRAEASLDVHVAYAPANASSYAYLDDRRPLPGEGFGLPGGCQDYNDWKYGLDRLPSSYLVDTGAIEARAQYARREVVYLLGTDDTGSANLDVSCEGNSQGLDRITRGRVYFDYVALYFGRQPHAKIEVPGVGHSSTGMYQSDGVRAFLFR